MINLKSPFPYAGGKSTVADKIWEYLGQPAHYIEPFFGSGAVLLNRPAWTPDMTETVNDKDGHIANVWRALKHSPDEVAKYCDDPVNHAELACRKKIIIANEGRLLENLINDDEWHDPEMAGYWIWAAACWIGTGLTTIGQIPHLADRGKGVHAVGKRPYLTTNGNGVHAVGQIPHLTNRGKGVHAMGILPTEPKQFGDPFKDSLYSWFRRLQERLRYVRVVCGEWNRVCGGDWQDKSGIVGIFFDPPYAAPERNSKIYHCDSMTVGRDVEAWCLERGRRDTYRIVCAGYEGEYQSLSADGWTIHEWTAVGGYSNQGKNINNNRKLERLFISPNCIQPSRGLFE